MGSILSTAKITLSPPPPPKSTSNLEHYPREKKERNQRRNAAQERGTSTVGVQKKGDSAVLGRRGRRSSNVEP